MIVRLHLEEEPEHAAIKLDNENHFNMAIGTPVLRLQAETRSATQHWRYSHAEQGSQCTPSPTIDYRQCHVTINCFDVATHLMGLPVRIGNLNLQTRKVTNLRNGTFLHLDRLCRRA